LLSAQLSVDDFELLGLPRQFALDRSLLDARWKDLQRQAHPDKFAAQGAAAQRVAMQWSVRINEAYQRLKSPLKRAAYLCDLAGAHIDAENNTAMPAEFLIQQMQWREELEEAQSPTELDELHDKIVAAQREGLNQLAHLLDVDHAWAQAAQRVRSLMFVERILSDVQARLDQV
jgi:molecular chaperone HscB